MSAAAATADLLSEANWVDAPEEVRDEGKDEDVGRSALNDGLSQVDLAHGEMLEHRRHKPERGKDEQRKRRDADEVARRWHQLHFCSAMGGIEGTHELNDMALTIQPGRANSRWKTT